MKPHVAILYTLLTFQRLPPCPQNFDKVINSHARVLVEFYSPGCGYCKQLAPEYAAAAAELKASGNKAVLAKVDADSESDLGSRYGVKGFPTLKWFVNGKMQDREYDGGRTAKSIVSWVIKRSGPTYIKSNEELDGEIAAARDKPIVIAILSDLNGAVARAFMIAHQDDASRSRAIFLMSSPGNMIQGTSSDAIIMMVSSLPTSHLFHIPGPSPPFSL
jgi:protein disulfide isomerase